MKYLLILLLSSCSYNTYVTNVIQRDTVYIPVKFTIDTNYRIQHFNHQGILIQN